MRDLPKTTANPNVLVGTDTSDDAGVYRLTDDMALIQTVDFFTPIVDDPYMFGQIAAANALSDVYAMGGEPKTALNIVGYPIRKLGSEMLAEILRGAQDKVAEAEAVIIGGHSIDDAEPKFGLSVTGVVHPEKIYKNYGARPGDVLVLTKPIGVGIQTTAIKQEKLTAAQIETVSFVMAQLNKTAARKLQPYHPHAVTDVTGFGLLGHAFEMARASGVTMEIHAKCVPVLAGTEALAQAGCVPGGTKSNLDWLKTEEAVHFFENIAAYEALILCDAVTSGGLLIALAEDEAEKYVSDLKNAGTTEATMIGRVLPQEETVLRVKK